MTKRLAAILLAGLMLAACDGYNDERGRGDAGVKDREDSPRTVVFNVDKFPNQAVLCDGTTGVYTNTRDGHAVAVENSEHCR